MALQMCSRFICVVLHQGNELLTIKCGEKQRNGTTLANGHVSNKLLTPKWRCVCYSINTCGNYLSTKQVVTSKEIVATKYRNRHSKCCYVTPWSYKEKQEAGDELWSIPSNIYSLDNYSLLLFIPSDWIIKNWPEATRLIGHVCGHRDFETCYRKFERSAGPEENGRVSIIVKVTDGRWSVED